VSFRISRHAREELVRRCIPDDLLQATLSTPQQVVPAAGGTKTYQSQMDFGGGRIFLLRAIVDERADPPVVVTVLPDQQAREVLEDHMKVTYDPETDVLRVLFSSAAIEESAEDKPGVILDYDKGGNIVGLEVLEASKRTDNPRSVEYAVAR
jgi:uncharacterized protein YuzE